MSGSHNLAKWQASRIPHRMKILEACISETNKKNIQFKCVSDLAKYLAELVTTKEHSANNQINSTSLRKISKPCHYTALLRAPYRSLLDDLMPIKQRNQALDRSRRELHIAETKILSLSNKCAELERINLALQSELDFLKNTKDYSMAPSTPNSDAPFLMVKALLRAFRDFCIIEDGRIVEATALKKEIVPSKLTKLFLEWDQEHR